MGAFFSSLKKADKANKNNNDNVDELVSNVHALPAELYNTVFDDVFTVEEGNIAIIDENYQPPIQLQINSPTRSLYASTYYANTIFSFHEDAVDVFFNFLDSLPRSHRLSIRRIHMLRSEARKALDLRPPGTTGDQAIDDVRQALLGEETLQSMFAMSARDGENYLRLDPDTILSTDILVKDDDGKVEERVVEGGYWGSL